MKLSRRRIVLTGGTSGIGRELATRLAPESNLVVLARETARSRQLLADLPGITLVHVDLSKPDDVADVGRQLGAGPAIDGLINCAALQQTHRFTAADFDVSLIRREIDINLTAVCLLSAVLLPALLARDAAFIMNVNSGLGIVPKTDSAVYCATKGGLNLFTQSLRYQLANTGVRVQQVFLPLVDTPMTEGRGRDKLAAGPVAARILDAIRRGTGDTDIGKVGLLRLINRIVPSVAQTIMKGS